MFAKTNPSSSLADGIVSNEDMSLVMSMFKTNDTGGIKLDIDEVDVNNLKVLGDTLLGDTTITGELQVGTIILDGMNNSIDTIGTFKIQPLALSDIEIMGGLVVFDTNGNIEIKEGIILGNKSFRGSEDITIGETRLRINKYEWESAPVSITATTNFKARVWITDKSKNGFTINLDTVAPDNAKVDWVAIW